MALKKIKPTTPGQRHKLIVTNDDITATKPEKSLVYGKRKTGAQYRSKLIETVLPEVVKKLEGSRLEGQEDAGAPLVFEYGELSFSEKEGASSKKTKKKKPNPFLQESTTVKVGIGIFPAQVSFRQSNKSRDFVSTTDDEQSRQADYIQVGNVLHGVLSTIRTSDDVEAALFQMEQDGLLYNGSLTRTSLIGMLRQRLASPRVAEWFKPGRWTLFNECTILTVDKQTGKVEERRPDRVMTDGRETIVVDFKFGREREEYHQQVRQYMQLLSEMRLPNVRGYLWLVYSNKIIEVTSLPS